MISKVSCFYAVAIFTSLFQYSVEDCRVLADCDGGNARWKDLSGGQVGAPGKRGAPGAQGQKGEPGLGVNITALKAKLQEEEDTGPKLHYYTSTVTWDSGKSFCVSMGKALCSFDQICLQNNGGRQLVDDVISGDNWVPLIDQHNEWTQIGNFPHKHPCFLHSLSGKPGWGTSIAPATHKGFVYCCEAYHDASLPDCCAVEHSDSDMRYQYIGHSATYESSEQHCEKHGRRLCYPSEICSNSKPRFGVAGSNQWAAVKDRRNEWIQIGNSGRSCGLHGLQHGLPSWGTRTDGSLLTHVGYVFCCLKTAER